MLGELAQAARQRLDRRRMELQRMIGRVARDHRGVDVRRDRLPDRVTEAAIDLRERARRVVEVGEVRDPHGFTSSAMVTEEFSLRHTTSASTAASRSVAVGLEASTAATTRLMPLGLRFQPAPYLLFA